MLLSQINDARLYRGLDVLHAHEQQLCAHLLKRYQDWFGVEFEFLLYDVTSTYFEGQALGNTKAARGYSRDHRPDCKQVDIGLVVTPEGLPVAYEVFAGNRADVSTAEQMVELMQAKYGKAKRTWVMDRGMISEANIGSRGARHLVGTPKGPTQGFRSPTVGEGKLGRSSCGGRSQAGATSGWWNARAVCAVSFQCTTQKGEGDDRTGAQTSAGSTGQDPRLVAEMPGA